QFKVRGSKLKVKKSSEFEVRSSESEAEECFLKAIEISRRQQAKSLELRATMSLGRLWQQQGKQHEARNMLSEVYGWFTEGVGTKDLQEAKALLAELERPKAKKRGKRQRKEETASQRETASTATAKDTKTRVNSKTL